MNTRRWVFVKKGLDDFRNGCPSWENMITRGLPEHPAPQRYSRGPRPPPRRRPSYLPEGAALCSRLSAAQRARKAFLEDIEAQLTQHLLAPCAGLEESLPPEVISCPLCGGPAQRGSGGEVRARKEFSLDNWGIPPGGDMLMRRRGQEYLSRVRVFGGWEQPLFRGISRCF